MYQTGQPKKYFIIIFCRSFCPQHYLHQFQHHLDRVLDLFSLIIYSKEPCFAICDVYSPLLWGTGHNFPAPWPAPTLQQYPGYFVLQLLSPQGNFDHVIEPYRLGTGEMIQYIKCLLYKHQDLSSIITTHGKVPGMVALAYKPGTEEAGKDPWYSLLSQPS